MAERDWTEFDGGSTLGRQGTEDGIIIKDEQHSRGARITLERDTSVAPVAITCGIYGWMVHTRFFRDSDEARREYDRMKVAVGAILSRISDAAGDAGGVDQMDRISSDIEDFIQMYP